MAEADWIVEPDSLMEMIQGETRTLSFRMLGEPPTQKRHRIGGYRGVATGPGTKGRFVPRVYDPSTDDKNQYKAALRAALRELGMADGTAATHTFAAETQLRLVVTFVCARPVRSIHQAYPRQKDLDNMVKFAMDAFDEVLYANDTVVVSISAQKTFPAAGSPVRAWTDFKFSTRATTTTSYY